MVMFVAVELARADSFEEEAPLAGFLKASQNFAAERLQATLAASFVPEYSFHPAAAGNFQNIFELVRRILRLLFLPI